MPLTKVTYSMINGANTNVLDFGAYNDGTNATATTAAIQTALNAGGAIYLPAGTYTINSALIVSSNTEIFGDGTATVLQTAADGIATFSTGTSTAKSGIIIRDLLIDGGGQTTNIYTGYKATRGIYITNAKDVRIENVTIQNMGIINQAAPQTDNGWSGMGIIAEARSGDIGNIRINNCTVKNVAGGGMQGGDGIYIAGYAAGGGTSYVDTVVSNCWVSTCGRHCYTVAGGSPESTPSGVKFINCYGEKSSLDWLDIEEGYDVTVDGATIYNCGNDQTYYDPATVFGSTYRLLAGIATGNDCKNIIITNTLFEGCYYGITFGSTDGLTISNTKIISSTTSDLLMGTAGSPNNLKLINVNCGTSGLTQSFFFYNLSANSHFYASGCIFASPVEVSAMNNGIFDGCTFENGFVVSGGSSAFTRNKFIGCIFNDWAGIGLQADGANYGTQDNIVESCTFYGTGNMTYGITFAYGSAARWIIKGCKFIGLTTAGIYQSNGNGIHTFDAYDNTFLSCAAGIVIVQAVNDTIISGNTFTAITGYCISITNINAGAPMRRTSVINNVAASGCTNGVQIVISTGTFDYCVLMGNNMNGCSGTKWSLSGGQNANGVTANNITT